MLFKPEVVAKFADCGVTFLDSAEDTIQLALKYLGLDPNTVKREDFKAAENLLLKVRPYIRSFDSSEYLNGLANKEVCVAMSWSSDYAQSHARAKAAGVEVNLAFTVPKEGANETFSSLLIPAGAPHPQAAYQFINFILRPDMIAEITNAIYYGNDNIASRPLVDPAYSCRRDPLSDAGDRVEAVQVRRGECRDRAHSHAHLDADQDGEMMARDLENGEDIIVASTDESHMNRVVSFKRMQDGTREDYELLERYERDYVQKLPDRILDCARGTQAFPRRLSGEPARSFVAGCHACPEGRCR